ncbi:hypothetical protein DLM78_13790 [Leptospira stimsonii]|uniref:Uncharacterized protein n=1 Tax=Leptospira stimsonii TaxID=2202203 RepID=A0A8B3CRG8_9LEPT|nr:hypothetical protein DLM78_13790 [Leptospira stimsonii]
MKKITWILKAILRFGTIKNESSNRVSEFPSFRVSEFPSFRVSEFPSFFEDRRFAGVPTF